MFERVMVISMDKREQADNDDMSGTAYKVISAKYDVQVIHSNHGARVIVGNKVHQHLIL